jgi:hypothetical protein
MQPLPNLVPNNSGLSFTYQQGMDLRDWFAGMAMLGMLSEHSGIRYDTDELTQFSYEVADAMMKARLQNDSMEEKTSVPKDQHL